MKKTQVVGFLVFTAMLTIPIIQRHAGGQISLLPTLPAEPLIATAETCNELSQDYLAVLRSLQDNKSQCMQQEPQFGPSNACGNSGRRAWVQCDEIDDQICRVNEAMTTALESCWSRVQQSQERVEKDDDINLYDEMTEWTHQRSKRLFPNRVIRQIIKQEFNEIRKQHKDLIARLDATSAAMEQYARQEPRPVSKTEVLRAGPGSQEERSDRPAAAADRDPTALLISHLWQEQNTTSDPDYTTGTAEFQSDGTAVYQWSGNCDTGPPFFQKKACTNMARWWKESDGRIRFDYILSAEIWCYVAEINADKMVADCLDPYFSSRKWKMTFHAVR